FWSFTSDGKRSQGTVADVTDVHAEAIGFEAEMPAGLARMVYWPDDDGGFFWVVESKNKKGWRRFVEHNYKPAGAARRCWWKSRSGMPTGPASSTLPSVSCASATICPHTFSTPSTP